MSTKQHHAKADKSHPAAAEEREAGGGEELTKAAAPAIALSWEHVPATFALCSSSSCPRADGCLHRAAALLLPAPPASPPTIAGVNPYHVAMGEAGEACPSYLPAAPVRMARGFRRVMDEGLTRRGYAEAMSRLRGLFSSGPLYERRNGVTLLTPAEQEAVAAILVDCGAQEPVAFDAYEEHFDFDLRFGLENR
ncbi:MAG: hypothetical protein IKR63_06800 [Alloprevotella sp.]|nr:hypothetical protein [Alloprevotella sp.]